LPKEESLIKKEYRFCQKRKLYPKIESGFAKKEKFSQEKI